MNLLKLLLAGAAITTIIVAFRDFENDGWLTPGGAADEEIDDTEPVLGYDGMDFDTLLSWIEGTQPGRDTLLRMQRYERTHQDREYVLDALTERLADLRRTTA